MKRIGAAIFNADHRRLGDEMRRTEAAGIDFFHWDVFDGYYLINTARGLPVDESALFAALKKKQIAGAAVDVFASEPPRENPLLELDNFLALPHCGGQTSEALRRLGTITAENVLRALRGEKVLYEV